MDERFLSLYEEELRHVREMAVEFGERHPLVAGRLQIRENGCEDPFVERMLEGFAFLAARVRTKLDADFPVFTSGLLETIYPSLLCPMPSVGLVSLTAPAGSTSAVKIERGANLVSHLGPEASTRCTFTTGHDITLFPLEIDTEGKRPRYYDRDISLLRLPQGSRAKAALRFTLKTREDEFPEIEDEDEITFFINGDLSAAGRIYEELFSHASHLWLKDGQDSQAEPIASVTLGEDQPVQLVACGFASEEALLPVNSQSFEGHRLLREYAALPQRFLFFKLKGLNKLLNQQPHQEIDIILGFNRASPGLAKLVSPKSLLINVTPVVNLFEMRTDMVTLSENQTEHHVVGNKTKPLHYEIFSIQSVFAQRTGQSNLPIMPFYRGTSADRSAKAFFSLNREPRLPTVSENLHGVHSAYGGSEVYMSIVDPSNAPYPNDWHGLTVRALCSNRHLPLSMPLHGRDTDLLPEGGVPISEVRWIIPPTRPEDSLVTGNESWKLISSLSLNFLSLVEDEGKGTDALREMIALFFPHHSNEASDWLQGLRSIDSKAIVRRSPGSGPVAFTRSLQVDLHLNESLFGGASPFLFGAVIARFLSKHVSINSSLETTIHSTSRGRLITWKPERGKRFIA